MHFNDYYILKQYHKCNLKLRAEVKLKYKKQNKI